MNIRHDYDNNIAMPPENAKTGDLVAILMCTYNGAGFLREQLDSIVSQTHKNWVLWISDDGSSDETLDIVAEYRAELGQGKIHIVEGPRQGFCANFLSLVRKCDSKADFFSWADQDDIWFPEKISRSVRALSQIDEGIPSLYCARTVYGDSHGRESGLSRILPKRCPDFRNALVQNLEGGNTIVFNKLTRKLLAIELTKIPFSHDWWAYIIVSGCGGKIVYDSKPVLLYRQHQRNAIGNCRGTARLFKRARDIWDSEYKMRIRKNILALLECKNELTACNQEIFEQFVLLHNSHSWYTRLKCLMRNRYFRKSYAEDFAFMFAALIGRV